MTPQQYIERVNEFIVPYLNKNGYLLIRTDFESEDGSWFLRLYIDLSEDELKKRQEAAEAEKAEYEQGLQDSETEEPEQEEPVVPGVSINDCVKVSRYLSKWLDKADFIKEAYTMEVCSKGFLDSSFVDSEEGESK